MAPRVEVLKNFVARASELFGTEALRRELSLGLNRLFVPFGNGQGRYD